MGRSKNYIHSFSYDKECLVCGFKCKNDLSMKLHFKKNHQKHKPTKKEVNNPYCGRCFKEKCNHIYL